MSPSNSCSISKPSPLEEKKKIFLASRLGADKELSFERDPPIYGRVYKKSWVKVRDNVVFHCVTLVRNISILHISILHISVA